MPRLSLALALLLLSACSKSTPAPTENAAPSGTNTPAPARSPAASAAAAPAPPPDGFDVKVKRKDGTTIPFRSAVVYQYQGSSALHIVAGTEKLTCAEATDHENEKLKPKEERLELVIAPVLRGDGTTAHAVMQMFHSTEESTASYAVDKHADARLVGEDPKGPVRATLSGLTGDASTLASFEGTIVAEGCGAVNGPEQEEDAPKSRPQPQLSLEVAKKKLDVRGAVYWPGRNLLVLSTRARGCSTTAIESEVDLYLSDDGSTARFGGFGVEHIDSKDLTKGPKIELGKALKEVMPAKINGSFQVGPYPVSLSGSVELLSCE